MPAQSAQERAYEAIKQAIVGLDFKAGEPLRAQDIAQRLGLSRTPVREALGRLQQEGLVQNDHGWGYVVRAMTHKEITDLFNLREILEVSAAVESLSYLDEPQLAQLGQHLADARQALTKSDHAQCRALNRDFRLGIAKASRNALLYQILFTINDRVTWLGSMQMQVKPTRLEQSLVENEAILEALRTGNAPAVRKAVLHHIKGARKAVSTNALARA
jgi:DNA-binding GntR family transcriptional regulator